MWRLLPLSLLLALAACGEGGARPAQIAPAPHVPVPQPPSPTALAAGVAKVQDQTGPILIAQFGKPRIDLTEGPARKLQFAGPICVLDAYLYARGRDATVTHIDTRQRDGRPIDQASCIAALSKR
ncbi:hypothetical protein OF829_01740 [Sphingomonas sp. LB-2]|uniref:hypothetical protein n=1 Tax=Sphingomonas caeni TaxID=2984949 RepID=UPI00223179A9|nr:hypothetical protein [Sphingomonas caeni]MCW3845946.1 hypothetical protein [Sphingomonas caeni]